VSPDVRDALVAQIRAALDTSLACPPEPVALAFEMAPGEWRVEVVSLAAARAVMWKRRELVALRALEVPPASGDFLALAFLCTGEILDVTEPRTEAEQEERAT
jgi:hypothetical protein